MSKFASRVKKFNIQGRTARVYLPELQHPDQLTTPWIDVKPTSQANRDYFNALLKLGTQLQRKKSSEALTVAAIKKDRLQQAALFRDHVIANWGEMMDDEGNVVDFSEDNVWELLSALVKDAPELFDKIRDVADNPSEFYEADEEVDVEELVGNSESDSSGS